MEEKKLLPGNNANTVQCNKSKKLTIIGEQEEEFKCEDSEDDSPILDGKNGDGAAILDLDPSKFKNQDELEGNGDGVDSPD